jgi:hypothetical protein
MKATSIVLLGLLAAGSTAGFVAGRHHTEPARLRAELAGLADVDLRSLTGSERARADFLFSRFADPVAAGLHPERPYSPLIVLSWAPSTPEQRLLLIRARDSGSDPLVSIWDAEGGYLDGRIWDADSKLESMRAAYRPEVDAWCLETWLWKAGARVRQFRLLRDGWFVLVRVEDEKGAILPMPQGLRVASAGGTAEEWPPLLSSYRHGELVYWMSWLKAPHVWQRTYILKDAALRAVLETYAMSPNRWVREAAELALRP